MSKAKGVSDKTHTKQQVDHYANQKNPNNGAYRADMRNRASMKSSKKA